MHTSDRTLAHITENRLDIAALQHMDPTLVDVLAIIRNPVAFDQLFLDRPRSVLRRSRLRLDNILLLSDWEVITPIDYKKVKVFCKYFQVPKKGDEDRLIVDCTPVNAAQKKAAKMRLPRIHEVMERIARFSCGSTIDAVSYFYQFPLHPDIALYFALANNGARGAPFTAVPNVMPMGWKYAPYLSQEVSLAICAEVLRRMPEGCAVDLLVWVDNFIFLANDVLSLRALMDMFLTVAAEISLKVHGVEMCEDGARLKCLGLSVDMRTHEFSFETSWVHKVHEARRTVADTYTDVASLIGRVLWSAHVKDVPLALSPHTIAACRVIADHIAAGVSWFDRVRFDVQHFLSETDTWLPQIERPFRLLSSDVDAVWVTSDGYSDEHIAAWAFTSGDHTTSSQCQRHMGIFMAELLGAIRALEFAASRGNSAILEVDNMGLLYALNKGHSCLPVVDRAIALLLSRLPSTFRFSVRHVHSEFNIADEYTRSRCGVQLEGLHCSQRVRVTSWG